MPKQKKKGGKGGKKEGATEEEKMQHKASAEQEMARRKEDLLSQFLKDKLRKEERNSAVNQHKIMQLWRDMLRKARTEEMQRDVDVLCQTFERVLDCKGSVIKSLVCDLEESEEQASRATQSHLQNVDLLMEEHRARLASLEQQWASELNELSQEFNMEREFIVSQHQAETMYLQDVSFAMEQSYKELHDEALLKFQSARDDAINRNMEEKHVLQMQMDAALERRWQQAQQALRSYIEATEDRQSAYENLHARDQRSTQEIDAQMKKIQKMQDLILALRACLSSGQREGEQEARDLRVAREEAVLHTQQLKSELSRARAEGRRQLAILTTQSTAAAKKLQSVIHKGEKLLRLSELCRKLETEQEKVLPFYTSSLSAEEEELVRVSITKAPSEELAKAMQDYLGLERFWQRYNKAQLEHVCLQQERAELGRENRHLRLLLQQYLDGISVSDEVLQRQNPLLTVSRRTPAAPPTARRTGALSERRVVIEAAHVAKHTL